MTFCVTGMGRSGTKFLATMLNRSPSWTVRHETSPGDFVLYDVSQVADRFRRERYGEVNGLLRWYLLDLPVRRRAVILRHPKSILLSALNRRPGLLLPGAPQWLNFLGAFARDLSLVYSLAERDDVLAISFARMTTDVGYLLGVARELGVDDMELKASDLQPVNATKTRHFAGLGLIPAPKLKQAQPLLDFFAGMGGMA